MRDSDERNEALAEMMRRLVLDVGRGSMNRIARRSDIDNGTLNKMLDGKKPRPEIIERIARAFPELRGDIYRVTGYEMPIGLIPGVQEAVEATGKPAAEVIQDAVAQLLKDRGLAV